VRRAATVRRVICLTADTGAVDEEDRPPICPRCGVTMVPAALSADDEHEGEWVCLECEELGEDA
jgi:transposase